MRNRSAWSGLFCMSKIDDISRVWDIIEKVGVCMLTTQFAGGLRARPIESRPDRDGGLIFFVTDIHSAKEDEIEARPDVGLVFVDPGDKAYLSMTARASVTRDAGKTRAAWRKTDEVWWSGPGRSERMPAADRACHRGIVGRTGERRRHRLRVCHGKVDRRGAEARRKPQDNGQDAGRVSRRIARTRRPMTGCAPRRGRVAPVVKRDSTCQTAERHAIAFPRQDMPGVMRPFASLSKSGGAGKTGCAPHPRALRAKKTALTHASY